MARQISKIVIHCSATRAHVDIGAATIDRWHREQGWAEIGYHWVIRRSGALEPGRLESKVGSHVRGHNRHSIGVCLIGGVGDDGRPANNFTPVQFATLRRLLEQLRARYPGVKVVGHRDLSPDKNGDGRIDHRDWVKACPSFSVADWLSTAPP